ncbi:hypothetical protein I4U23_013008 [Adineta vaga]|nr:hypothetical protein I4U23_013008 [Adineta vaga]
MRCTAFIAISFGLAAFALLYGAHELWQVNIYIERQCLIKSYDPDNAGGKGFWRAYWKVQILNEQIKTKIDGEDSLRSYYTYFTKSGALEATEKKKINQIYTCYKYGMHPFDSSWYWYWRKPSKLLACFLLSISPVLLITGCILCNRRMTVEERGGLNQMELSQHLDAR